MFIWEEIDKKQIHILSNNGEFLDFNSKKQLRAKEKALLSKFINFFLRKLYFF